MQASRYEAFHNEEMILRDHLALERTALANERTLLSYVRTTISLIAVGATILKIFEGWIYAVAAWLLIIIGIAFIVAGAIRYTRIELLLARIVHSDSQAKKDHFLVHEIGMYFLRKLHLAEIK